MTQAPLSTAVRHIRRALADSRDEARPDRDLLHDFEARRDPSAFAAIVRRYGPLVLGVCRRVLGHEQDAEDAFQATFLVLARRADSVRRGEALPSFLHGVARRVALKLRRAGARRRAREGRARVSAPESPAGELAWREVQSVLDEEVRRLPEIYRSVFVLRCLDGVPHARAADALGLKEGTLASRLAHARKLLRAALVRRGITLGATLAVLAGSARAAVPPALADAAVRAGIGLAGAASAKALLLAEGALSGLCPAKVKLAALVVLVFGLLGAGAAALSRREAAAGEPATEAPAKVERPAGEKPHPEGSVTLRGTVLDPDGKPAKGAEVSVHAGGKVGPAVKTGADGSFRLEVGQAQVKAGAMVIARAGGLGPDWADVTGAGKELTLRLVKDVPITGRVVDLEGKPVAGVTLRVRQVNAWSDLNAYLEAVRRGKLARVFFKQWYGPLPGVPARLTTGADGRFRLAGVGRDREVCFFVEEAHIQHRPLKVVTRKLAGAVEPPRETPPFQPSMDIDTVHGADFVHAAAPGQRIRGVVRGKDGKPVAGAEVWALYRLNPYQFVRLHTTTGSEGRYELRGLPKSAKGYELHVNPPNGAPYFSTRVSLADRPGLVALKGDVGLAGGTVVRGRVTHHATGKPLADVVVNYYPLYPNAHARRVDSGTQELSSARTRPDGSYSLVVLPGPGVLGFRTLIPDARFRPALVTARELKDLFKDDGNHGNEDTLLIQGSGAGFGAIGQTGYHHLLLLDPGEKEKGLRGDVTLWPAQTVRGKVEGPDGKPLAGASAYGLKPWEIFYPTPLKGANFEVQGYDPRRGCRLVFLHTGKKLGVVRQLRGEVKGPLTVRLGPCATVAGRILDGEGRPIPGLAIRVERESVYDRDTPLKTKTDQQGRFRVEGLVAGQNYHVIFERGKVIRTVFRPLVLKPGQTKDVGDLTAKGLE